METSHNTFYSTYLKEYHYVKALLLKKNLTDIEEINSYIKTKEFHTTLTENSKFIIQSDIRQNYFHCIETFFEFFFALIPKNNIIPDNRQIINKLVNSKWRANYNKISDIANEKMKLDFLDNVIDFQGHKISIGHYLFYLGTFSKEKFGEDFFESVNSSIKALKKGIVEIAKDFENRDEYNAYKHALRVYPNFQSIKLLNAETQEQELEWDLSNSVSYQIYNTKKNETIIKTKLFDPERDVKMTLFCSNMIQNIISFREIAFNKKNKNLNEKVVIKFFGSEAIDECLEHNVNIQDLSFSTQLIKKGYS